MLKNVSLFSNLPDDVIQSLSTYTKKHTFPKNAVIFMEGDPSNQLYLIKSGKVKVFVDNEDGKQVILNIHEEGDYFGELALLDDEPRSASIMTLNKAELLSISQADFKAFLDANPMITIGMMKALAKRIRTLTDNIKDFALLDVYGRIANLLQSRISNDEGLIQPRLTHQEIANMVGASREMVSRIMRELVIGEYIEQTTNALLVKKPFPHGW